MVRAFQKTKTLFLVGVLCFVSLRGKASELDPKSGMNEFPVLRNIEKSLNQLATKSKIKERISSITEPLPKVSEAPVIKAIPNEKVAASMLPTLSTDPTRINKVDINQTGFEGISNAGDLWKAADAAIEKQSILPLPVARVVPEVGEKYARVLPKESPLLNSAFSQGLDTIPQLAPQNTRFGKDKYDQEKLFKEEKPKVSSLVPPSPLLANPNLSPGGPMEDPFQEEKDKEKEKELEEKRAREKLDKVILEYAERTEEKSAFNLVDYYDLKGLVSENQELLGKIQDEEFDERFLKNARLIYERFGTKDNSEDKEPFEKFLRRLEPPPRIFRPNESLRKTLPRNSDTHRDQLGLQEESKRSPQVR